jgi:glycosyltransferase involved in cell wall biosynthesis
MKPQLRILHLSSYVGMSSFGIGSVVLNLARSQQSLGYQAEIWSCDANAEARALEEQNHLLPNSIRTFPVVGPSRLAYSPALENALIQNANRFDLIHQHGIWTAISRAVNKWRVRTGKPTVIAPHGSLNALALRRSAWKKRLALFYYERENLQKASCLHALSRREAEGFRAFGLKNPIAIIHNGISEDWICQQGDECAFRERFGLPEKIRLLFFLGRITPIKGLTLLLQAMSALRPCLKNWKLIIAGVDEFNHQKELKSLAVKLSLESHIQFVGPLYGKLKRDAFAAVDLFVLPSYSEASPMAILEALGAGVPVLATNASSWQEIVTLGCGWLTDISEIGIRKALNEAINTPREVLREMGQRGKALVAQKYTMNIIAEKVIYLYNWLLKREEKPSFLIDE